VKKRVTIPFGVIIIVFIVIQFIPAKLPKNSLDPNKEIIQFQYADEKVMTILKTSCYDCHSNQTVYHWYAHVAPVSWLIAHDVSEGRETLNFSEWNTYEKRKLVRKLGDIKEEISKKDMPMSIYTVIHPNAKLSQTQMTLINDWTDQLTQKIMGK
jgi:hypothetical protein